MLEDQENRGTISSISIHINLFIYKYLMSSNHCLDAKTEGNKILRRTHKSNIQSLFFYLIRFPHQSPTKMMNKLSKTEYHHIQQKALFHRVFLCNLTGKRDGGDGDSSAGSWGASNPPVSIPTTSFMEGLRAGNFCTQIRATLMQRRA